jgi:hypothetical protein
MERAAVQQQGAVTGHDKFSFAYFLWVALIFLLFASSNDLDRIFNLYLLLVPLLFLPALAVVIYCVVALIRNVMLRRWRRVISVLVAPVAAYLLLREQTPPAWTLNGYALSLGSGTTSLKSKSLRGLTSHVSRYSIGDRRAEPGFPIFSIR